MATKWRYTALLLASALAAACASDGNASEGTDRADGTPSTTEAPATSDAATDVDLVLASSEVVATVDQMYQSYNVEMVEVTGGEFWQPYDAGEGKVVTAAVPW